METKICSGCKRKLPILSFHKDKSRRDGVQTYCKECSSEKGKQRYPGRAARQLVLCRKWAIEHIEKVREINRRYNAAHPDKIRENQKRYSDSHKKERAESTKRSRSSSTRFQEYQKRYRSEHPDKVRAMSAKRRALKQNNGHTPYNFQEIFDRDKGTCYLGKKKVDPKHWNLDHVVPISRGGSDTPDNVGVLCPHHNKVKYTRLLGELDMATIGECGE